MNTKTMSVEAREKIGAAQKKRWRLFHKQQRAAQKHTNGQTNGHDENHVAVVRVPKARIERALLASELLAEIKCCPHCGGSLAKQIQAAYAQE